MTTEIIIAAIGLLGGGGVVAAIRFHKKDAAEAGKIHAEANSIIVENFKGLIKTYQDENKILQLTVNELKTEVYKLREEINRFKNGGR